MMRTFKIIFMFVLMLASAVLAALTYLQSHGAGISTAMLFAIVILSYLYDNGRQIAGMKSRDEGRKKSSATRAAIRQSHAAAIIQDKTS